ncbi:leucine-rich repeats and immunoglobulin-like domains protein 3 [Phlebotomus argentipes]|uniref:leucine-rich repeats and immunoglobulin-like domains protein 3 n=1 Tax=Phlebotomus argentipes TaxID=94469 RepID=UPI0028933367|nr:leucine-rich repeats and immunoglobulin-like domains protein 3 [Phlebotomus argentipes]
MLWGLLLLALAGASDPCPSQCACLGVYVDCGKRGLQDAPRLPNWMETLELSGNRLGDSVTLQVANLSTLRELKLNKNRLQHIPLFEGLHHLTALSLSHNRIEMVDAEALERLPKLQHLDISRNLITHLPRDTFPTASRIRSLNLNYNAIESVHGRALEPLRHLTELKMNGNRLTVIEHDTFAHLSSLRKLQITDNKLEVIQALTFRNLVHLRTLRMRRNRIHTLMDGAFHGCVSLTSLELDENGIGSVSKRWLFNLTSLAHLSVSRNRVSEIEADAWEFVGHLEGLDLSGNRLLGIARATLAGLGDLKRLSVRDNRLSAVEEGAFGATPRLQSLDLSGNEISWAVEDMNAPFGALHHLRSLHLAANRIKSVSEKAFLGLNALQRLDLTGNNLTSLHSESLDPMPGLRDLLINTTSLLCDCHLQWLTQWIEEHPNVLKGDAVCNFPVELRHKTLGELLTENLTCSDTPRPAILSPPAAQMAIKGSNVTLECRATASAPMVFQWRKDNVELSAIYERSEEVNATEATSRVHLKNVSQEHAGRYQCAVGNAFGVTYSAKNLLAVGILPVFLKVPSNVTVAAGATARLNCGATGDPKPQISWQKDGGNDFPAARERRMHVMTEDDAFFIIHAKTSDQGVYTCTAENSVGVMKVNATLLVQEAPSFVRPMESKEVSVGAASVLECLAGGSPKPMLRWTKDGAPIDPTERHFFAAEEQLLIIVATQAADAGAYECEIRNELGVAIGGARLSVIAAPRAATTVNDIVGIVVITVVLCAVVTSIVWVAIIYKTKRTAEPESAIPSELPPPPSAPDDFLVVNIQVNQLQRMLDEPSEAPQSS